MTEASQAETSRPAPIERLRLAVAGKVPAAGITKTIGMQATAAEPGRVVMEMDVGPQHHNPMGTLHGGVLCDLADAAMGMCYVSTLAAGETFTTLELKINFLKPVFQGHLRAEGVMLRPGKTVGLVECKVTDDKGSLVAHATSTCMTLRGEAAKGR
ncbi:MAG TPA: PaaI family thioesterase [bacterium]